MRELPLPGIRPADLAACEISAYGRFGVPGVHILNVV